MTLSKNHTVPKTILTEAKKALSFYPALENILIEIKFKKRIKKSTMLAQPKFSSLFNSKNKRRYIILVSETFKISDTKFSTKDLPKDVLIGWIGHELGHIMDYQRQNSLALIWFGIRYLFSENHIIKAERAADTFAVSHGMHEYILKTKNFILNHADINQKYKMRIKKYYLSPEEIMDMVTK